MFPSFQIENSGQISAQNGSVCRNLQYLASTGVDRFRSPQEKLWKLVSQLILQNHPKVEEYLAELFRCEAGAVVLPW